MSKVAYIYGRPGPHPFHRRLGEAIDADFVPVDFLLRWHDRQTGRLHRYMSWAACALRFPRRHDYDLFLTDGPHIPPLILKQLGLLRKNQRVAALMSNEMLYFLKAGRYSKRSTRAILFALSRFDALICLGAFQTELAHELLSQRTRKPRILTGTPGFFESVAPGLRAVKPRLDGKQLLFIGHGHGAWGAWYKGIDLLLETFKLAAFHVPDLTLDIVGRWDDDSRKVLRSGLDTDLGRVRFLGWVPDLATVLSESALCVHLGRGDAFPASVVESMLAGVPALVSDQVGVREPVARVDSRLVVPADPKIAAERVRWYLGLGQEEKDRLSEASRQVAESYTEDKAVRAFKSTIDHIQCA